MASSVWYEKKILYIPISALLLIVSCGFLVLPPSFPSPMTHADITILFLPHCHSLSKLSPPFLYPLSVLLPPSHSALACGALVVMESLFSHCETQPIMRLLSHTPYQINRLQQPITTQTHQQGPRPTMRLTSLDQQKHFVIDRKQCKQRQ